MSEDYTLMTVLQNIKEKGIVYALKQDAIETALRYPAWTVAACVLYNALNNTDSGLCGFAISHKGNLRHDGKELYPDGVWR